MATAAHGPSGDLALEVLQSLSKSDPVISSEVFPHVKPTEVRGALDRLASRSMVTYKAIEKEEFVLEPEGEQIAAKGSHEARVFEALRQAMDGLSVADLEKAVGDKTVAKLGQSKAFKEKWIAKTKDGKFKTAVSALAWGAVGGFG